MQQSSVEFSIILPAFNEAPAVLQVLRSHHEVLARLYRSFEILVIDDASTDDTAKLVEVCKSELPSVRMHRNERNLGQAGSLKVGFRLAQGEVVMHNAFDLPFSPDDIRLVKEACDTGADVVVVERTSRGAYGLTRRVISHANVVLLRALFMCPVRDYNFVQAYRRSVLASIEARSTAAGSVTPELIVRARRAGFRVETIAATYHGRRLGRSTVNAKTVVASLAQTLALFRLLRAAPPDVRKATQLEARETSDRVQARP